MPQSKPAHTISTMMDAIAPNRVRFNVINNSSPKPAQSATMRAIDKAAAELGAKGPVFPNRQKSPLLPGVTCYGKITDQPAYTAAALARIAARKGGAL